MKTKHNSYPFFDANQVLTNNHLNTAVDYLEEQERLTRANLIGIGIPCGLDLTLDDKAGSASIFKGCAVGSLGYLLIEPDDVVLTGYRSYKLPDGDAYAPFMDGDNQLPLWELFPEAEPNVTKLAGFLADKCVLLFLERDKADLSDCSPNNCDDKGSVVTFTLRRLVVNTSQLAIISGKSGREPDDSGRLKLPDLRLHRYDTPRTGPVSTREVLEAFQAVVRDHKLVGHMSKALLAAYDAFEPLLSRDHPSNPFLEFKKTYGFLEGSALTPRQVAFMPYFMDFFSDLLAAYEEFRERALGYSCVCCPAENWFPRHVVLGPKQRTRWYPSGASCCDCEPRRREVVQLFTRLVEITLQFDDDPSLRPSPAKAPLDEAIRITPSRAGTAPLSARCIPYYYDFKGGPPLYRLWNPALTGQGRAHHNQGYRSYQYQPDAPPCVETPLTFDLESFDFLRIEGHLGKDYRAVLARLEDVRTSHRLPFNVVAVSTGRANEALKVDPSEHACRFQDLESAYKVVREELSCLAKKSVMSLGRFRLKQVQVRDSAPSTRPALGELAPVHVPLSGAASLMGMKLAAAVKHFNFETGTIGAAYIDNAKTFGHEDLTLVGESSVVNAVLSVLNKLAYLTSLLGPDLESVDWSEFEKTVQRLQKLSESISREGDGDATEGGLSWQELNRQIVSVVYACRLEGFLAIRDEYLRRLQQIRTLSYFDGYVKEHPAIQHKAGVPVGGTFVMVYHGGSEREGKSGNPDENAYASAIEALKPGTVIADFCLPYQCCSDCAPIQFVLGSSETPPVKAPTIEFTLGCTDAQSQARVEIEPSGGTAPYQLSLNGEVQEDLIQTTISLTLAVGTYTLQATDVNEIASSPVTMVIPAKLEAGAVEYRDDVVAKTFTASFDIQGGTPPFSTSIGAVEDRRVTVAGLKSGAEQSIEVKDSNRCKTTVAIKHDVAGGCDKPCKGKAARSRYPVWAPQPTKTTPYVYKAMSAWKLTIADDGATTHTEDLTRAVQDVLNPQTSITEATYADVMSKVCGVVSKAVDSALAGKFGERAFVLEYDRKERTLVVESYSCHKFRFDVEFTLSGDSVSRTEQWSYASAAVSVSLKTATAALSYSMPAFGRIDMDKCTNEIGKDCRVNLKGITPETSGNVLILEPLFGDNTNVARLDFLWRVDAASPMLSKGPKVKVPVNARTPVQVQLLVIDRETLCWAFAETSIAPRPVGPIRAPRRPR